MPQQPPVKSVRFTTPVYPVRDLSGYLRHSDSFSLKMDNMDRVKFSKQSSPLKYSVIGIGKIDIWNWPKNQTRCLNVATKAINWNDIQAEINDN